MPVRDNFLKVTQSTETPVETSCPVAGHTKTKVLMVASKCARYLHIKRLDVRCWLLAVACTYSYFDMRPA